MVKLYTHLTTKIIVIIIILRINPMECSDLKHDVEKTQLKADNYPIV